MNQKSIVLLLLALSVPFLSHAEASAFDTGDTAWMLIATALVMLMTPAGLTLFYGGLTRRKSVLNTIGMSYTAFCTATVVWVVIGYSLAFSEGNGFIGGLDYFMLHGIKIDDLVGSIPHLLFIMFQGTFAAIAVALVSGSIIERVKYSTWFIFSILWVMFIYSPIAHMVWGGGILSDHGELDFAGGTVIHINAGISGLVLVYLIGNRKGHKEMEHRPSSTKLMLLGSSLLWFGWFGFNGGSALAADFIAANALLVTNVAAAAGGLAWLIVEWVSTDKRPTLLGSASGVVSGLVGITPASGYVDVTGALVIGAIAGLIGYFGVVKLKVLLGYDDTLDVFGIHGLVGIFGAIATGFFANPEINGEAGLLYGNPSQVIPQLIAVGATVVYSGLGSYILFKITGFLTGGGRVEDTLEDQGMDLGYHGEESFDTEDYVESVK
ncbi:MULTISPECIES: ammonium transporter [Reichenbachiella]|uniref:Ammonium transporter n=1 Tax=Reichenbachiella agariperforans TaxID=156994 RepID=A0A1M6SV23_REIAG|nr:MULTISPECIES: ammonium transporter [Reichenbachiella]MBU2916282.1 ammonium transporter [Reichenbachiella agariperforans]RJE75128.1 ammonia channel protein [Reichenbachiella sp. MSK19-1]SHK48428.1 ammonium transporter (TC 1.A.11) [Reichenbachiella agariperforans]